MYLYRCPPAFRLEHPSLDDHVMVILLLAYSSTVGSMSERIWVCEGFAQANAARAESGREPRCPGF